MSLKKKSSSNVSLSLVTVVSAATTLISCGSEPQSQAVCVDKENKVVESRLCEEQASHYDSNHGSGMPLFFYWYLLTRGGSYPIGSSVSGGRSFVPGSPEAISSGHSTISGKSSGSVSRGGFGSSSSSHGTAGE